MAATNLTDIKGTRYEEAVENLIEIGLVNGYPEDNTYRPTVTVTRAQMAKMMVVALGEEGKVSAASKTVSTFSDIKLAFLIEFNIFVLTSSEEFDVGNIRLSS
jgi:hypothetical protein